MFLMHRVELKDVEVVIMLAILVGFLMHRVELKVRRGGNSGI